jgi:hypothetical protein
MHQLRRLASRASVSSTLTLIANASIGYRAVLLEPPLST